MYLLRESGFVEGRKHSQAFVEPHNKWWVTKGGKLGLELCSPRLNKMVSAGPATSLKSNAGFNEHTLSILGAERKPWDTICLCLSVLAAFIFFPSPQQRELFRTFICYRHRVRGGGEWDIKSLAPKQIRGQADIQKFQAGSNFTAWCLAVFHTEGWND